MQDTLIYIAGYIASYEQQIINPFSEYQASNPLKWSPLNIHDATPCDLISGLVYELLASTTSMLIYTAAACNVLVSSAIFTIRTINNFISEQNQRCAPWYIKVCSALSAGFSLINLAPKLELSIALSGLLESVSSINLSGNHLGQFS